MRAYELHLGYPINAECWVVLFCHAINWPLPAPTEVDHERATGGHNGYTSQDCVNRSDRCLLSRIVHCPVRLNNQRGELSPTYLEPLQDAPPMLALT